MRIGGFSIWAVLVAAVAMWVIGAAIYGALFSELWLSYHGLTKETAEAAFAGQEWRMALSPLMPLVIAGGIALAMGWRGAAGLMGGARTGFILGLLFLAAGRLYNFVYSAEPLGLFALDAVHLLLGATSAGAVIGAWPVKKAP